MMNTKKESFTNNLLFLVILFSLDFSLTFASINFVYPYALTLKNGNIFVVHKTGITICDSSYSTSIDIIIFSSTEQISSEDVLSKVSISQFDDGYIVAVLINYIYIFDTNGNFKFKGEGIFSYSPPNDMYYSITPHHISNDKYYYLIGYILNNLLYLKYYEYNSITNKNKISIEMNDYMDKYYYDTGYEEFYIQNKGISCQFMYYKSEDIITCTYYIAISSTEKYLSFAFLYIYLNMIVPYYKNKHYGFDNIKCIKSAIGGDRSKALFCSYKTNGESYCYIYDFNMDKIYYYSHPVNCRNSYYGMKVDYFPETEEFAFSCLTDEGGIHFRFYNKYLNNGYNRVYKFTKCENIYGYSLLYSKSSEAYYILSDVKCQGNNFPYEKLFEDIIEIKEEEIEEEKEEKIEEKEEEEEEQIEENIGQEVKEEEKEEIYDNVEGDIEEEIINEEKYENKLEEIEEETIIEIEEEEIVQNKCYNLEKCELCNEESILMNLCIKCNNNKGYYYLNENSFLTQQETNNYIECIKKNEKPSNFYFNQENKDFRLCYETCNTCEYGGDGNINNCTSCDINYFFKPDINNTTNCVIKCSFFYYYNKFGQYKCTSSFQCPKDYNLLVKAKKKCINNCEYDDTYKYQYNGECLIKCPNNTYHRDNEYICKDININKCLLSENCYYSLNENLTDNEIELFSKNYAKEFKYTDNHVSIFKNNIYTITLYKNSECISDLSLEIPEIDFGECYIKVKKNYKIFDNLIIAIISKYFEGKNYQKMISFSMFEPINGTKLLFYEICKEDIIVIKENLIVKMDNSTDMKSLFYLVDQDIDIFNLSSAFYTDICYHFNSPVEGKDIALKDRILLYFPNVTLCEEGCQIKGVNPTTFKAICECLLDNLMGSNIFGNNILYQSSLGEIESLIKKTNIEVIKCYKDLLILKYYNSNTGGFIIQLIL